MDTQNAAVAEIPNFKLAKVGKDRERKRGGVGWFGGGRGVGSGFGGVGGASGAGGGLFGLSAGVTKTVLMLALSVLASGAAWQLPRMAASRNNGMTAPMTDKLFADKGEAQYGDLSGVIKESNSIPNSLGYVSGSRDGLTPEERAKKAAEEEAARKAAEEAQAKADAEAAKKAAEEPQPAVPADGAMAKKHLTAGKFGALGSFGGGSGGGQLSGGAGLSGGINRNFGAASNLRSKPQSGTSSGFRTASRASRHSSPRALASKSQSKGFAKRQLDKAFGQSRQAMTAGRGETAAENASAPFDNNPGAGNIIAGPGVGNTTQPGNSGGANTLNPGDAGGPLGGPTAACGAGQAPDVNGNCQNINTTGPHDGAPYQSLIDTAKILMALVAVLALIAIILEKTGYGTIPAQILKGIIITVGVIILGLGAAILAQSGDKMMGGIVMAVGACTVGSAFLNTQLLGSSSQTINMAAGVLISNAVGALAASASSKSQLQ